MIICLKAISEEGCLFNGNAKITYTSPKLIIKVPTQKIKINLYKNQIYIADLKSFSNQYLSGSHLLKKIVLFATNESPLKMIENAFLLHLKNSFHSQDI